MQRVVKLGGAVAAVVAVPAAVVGLGIGLGLRYRWPFVLDGLRHFSRTVFNPQQMESAGEPGAYASIIEHVGRVTGTPHRTPIVARPIDGGFVISLTYGTRADWVRNVAAVGAATLITEGQTHRDLRAEITPLTEAGDWTSASERRMLRWLGIDTCLRLTGTGQL